MIIMSNNSCQTTHVKHRVKHRVKHHHQTSCQTSSSNIVSNNSCHHSCEAHHHHSSFFWCHASHQTHTSSCEANRIIIKCTSNSQSLYQLTHQTRNRLIKLRVKLTIVTSNESQSCHSWGGCQGIAHRTEMITPLNIIVVVSQSIGYDDNTPN